MARRPERQAGQLGLTTPATATEHYWSFEPDGARAQALSAEVNRRLIDSLRYVFDEAGAALGIEPARFKAWIDALEKAGRPDPLVHTLFHALVAEIQSGDIEAATPLAERLLTLSGARPGLGVHPVDDVTNGARPLALFSRFVDLEEDNRLDLKAPGEELVASVVPVIDFALDLIARNDPALDGELRALVAELLLVGQEDSHLFTTAAVSCFQNWGGLLVNPVMQKDALIVIETLAHEMTHLLLFGLAMDEPLLTNDPNDHFHSPIRNAPRTMDGVYHATIVAARSARALLRQAEAAGADTELREIALERAAPNVRLFDEGVEIVEANAKLTAIGRSVLDDSKAEMAKLRSQLFSNA
jgi:HEXXH motif-containing protein